MLVDYAEGHGLPEVCDVSHLIDEQQPQFEIWPPGDLYVRHRHNVTGSKSASISEKDRNIVTMDN